MWETLPWADKVGGEKECRPYWAEPAGEKRSVEVFGWTLDFHLKTVFPFKNPGKGQMIVFFYIDKHGMWPTMSLTNLSDFD